MCINFGLVCMLAGAFQNQTSGPVHRKFFDKMMLNPTISVMDQKNAERFLAAMVEYDNPLELLYRMTDERVNVFFCDVFL